MILFLDNRGLIFFNERIDIACLDSTPHGELYVEITPEWIKNPQIPLIKIDGIFPPELTRDVRMLSAYLDGWKRQLKCEKMYLSIFKSQVEVMDKKYALKH